MPTVFRFLTILATIAAVIYGAMVLLVALVEPRQTEMSVNVPLDHIRPVPAPAGSTPAEDEAFEEPPADGPAPQDGQ